MKQWVKKLLEQFEFENGAKGSEKTLSEELASILFIVDTLNKNLIELENHPVRKVRAQLDEFAKEIASSSEGPTSDILFRLRQFYSSYRIDECSYFLNTFDDFKRIIWDFADQLADDIRYEKSKDQEVSSSLQELREAVESNSIDILKAKSYEFINNYKEYQSQKDDRRTKRIGQIRKSLNSVKRQLVEANQNMRLDHLTQAYNRKSFDEQMRKYVNLYQIEKTNTCLLVMDIDHFKKINDAYGHDIGDFVITECVRLLKEVFNSELDFVARIGGEEFAVIAPQKNILQAAHKAEEALKKIRNEVFVQDNLEIRFTISIGLAQLCENETPDEWLKRADQALYLSKNTGRNKLTVSENPKGSESAA